MEKTLATVITWLTENWVVVALIASETAALLPTKVRGIVQGTITIIGMVFQNKSSKTKNKKS